MSKKAYYFTHDYHSRHDPKMIKLQIKHGMAGIGCFWCIVEMLYEEDGEIRNDFENIAFELRTEPKLVKSVMKDFGLFTVKKNMLSSDSVQKRMVLRNEKSLKARDSIQQRWLNQSNTNVLKNDTNVSKTDTPQNTNVSKNDTIKLNEIKLNEIKLNEIKLNEIKGNEIKKDSSAKISENGNFCTEQEFIPVDEDDSKNKKKEVVKIEFRAATFRSEMDALLNSTLARYSVFEEEMETFYAYWTEANSSKTKMRFEMQKTFEISKRIGYWIHRAKKSIIRNPEQEDKTSRTLRICQEQTENAMLRIMAEEAAEEELKQNSHYNQ